MKKAIGYIIILCFAGIVGYGIAEVRKPNVNISCEVKKDFQNEECVQTIEQKDYMQNEAYKIFYGIWEYTSVVSEHIRLGGDEDYQSLLGEKVVYSSDYFACGEEIRIDNPNYLITIVPLRENGKHFFNEQIDLKKLLPEQELLIVMQVVDKPLLENDSVYYGTVIVIKNDSVMYAYDNNCIYELTRIAYTDEYNMDYDTIYHERY